MLRSRSSRRHLALVSTLVLAAGAAGCGSSADAPDSRGGGVAAGPGIDGPPAKDADAIRAALGRTEAAWKRERTARVSSSLETGVEDGEKSTATHSAGTVELTTTRYLLKERIGDGDTLSSDTYGEKGRSWTRSTGPLAGTNAQWEVLTPDDSGSEPLSLVRLLGRAEVLRVGDTAELGGATCRWFDGEIKILDTLERTEDPSSVAALRKDPAKLKTLFGDDRENAAFPLRACVDDRGLTYALDQDFDAEKTIGGTYGKAIGRSVQRVRLEDYGTAPSPERPAGIDSAKPR